jgi:hypothetical protein
MLKLYRKSQTVQYEWIRKHPVLWVTSNVALTVAFIGYIEYKNRREMRKFQDETDQQES